MQCRDLLWRISGQRKIYTQIVCEGSQSNCFSRLIHFPLGHFRWSAFYCILTVMVVCIICACKLNQVEELWTTVAFMKPFALLYCSALLCKQRHTQSTHHPTHTWTCTYAAVQTLLPLLPNWYNGLYFHSSLDANWMRIYHEARAMCEKWGMSLFLISMLPFIQWLSCVCICFFFLGVAFAAESCLHSQPFLQLVD